MGGMILLSMDADPTDLLLRPGMVASFVIDFQLNARV